MRCSQCNGYSFTMCYNSETKKYDISKYGSFCSFSCSAKYSEIEYNALKKLKKTNPDQVKEIKIQCGKGFLTILKHVDNV